MRTHYWTSLLAFSALALSACQRPATVAAPEPMSPGYPDNIALRQRGLIADSSSAATTPTQTASATAPPTNKPESLEAWGKQLFTQHGCVSCHSNKQVAPSLEGLYGQGARKLASGATVKTDEAYIRESIINPAAKVAAGYPPIMPSFKHLPQEEVDALIAYIKSL
jgi:mono/diheme cytochrome c family protein